MNKKIYFVLIFSILFSCNAFSHGQNSIEGTMNEKISFQKQMENINQIKLFFCNEGLSNDKLQKQLFLETQAGKHENICLLMGNFGNKDVEIKIGFSHGYLNKQGGYVCDQDISKGNDFSKIVYSPISDNSNNIYLQIPAQKQKQINITLKTPKNQTGKNIGCIAYMINGDVSRGSGSVFDVVLRKVATVDFYITGGVYKFGFLQDTSYYIKENQKSILRIIVVFFVLGIIKNLFLNKKTSTKKQKSKKNK